MRSSETSRSVEMNCSGAACWSSSTSFSPPSPSCSPTRFWSTKSAGRLRSAPRLGLLPRHFPAAWAKIKKISMREKIAGALTVAAALLLAYNLYQIFMVLPDDAMQGPIYRILFFHVPAAITGMIGYFVALGLSIAYLATKKFRYDSLAASVVEVSVVFSIVNIVTGSIWERVIWGIWWTWDARLTSALVCVLIFSAYVMMRRAIDEPTQRARLSAALCIFGCVDVEIGRASCRE